ncbi:MAG: DNA-directed DNA polymerase [Candidatus Bathyarchaeia archaeon]
MKLKFWLLDLNPKIDDTKTEVQLWGIDENGNRVLVIDRGFVAYFYAVLVEGVDAAEVAEKISSSFGAAVQKVEVVMRRYFGKPVKAVKVYCSSTKQMTTVAKAARKFEGVQDCLEDDIRVPMRYLYDNNLVPCSWMETEVQEEEPNSKVRADKVYVAESPPKQLEIIVKPQLRVLSFSMISYSREGSPKPDRNPVIIISVAANNGEEHQFTSLDTNDRDVIQQFIEYMHKFDPDVIFSYGGNSTDWNYLVKRSRQLGRTFAVDRAGNEPHTSVYGHVSFTGRANVDLADFMNVFPDVKVQTLWNLAQYLGVKADREQPIEDVEFAVYWDDPKKQIELKQFSLNNARRVLACAGLLLDFAEEFSSLTVLPLDHVMTAATGFRVESFLIRQVQKIGELTPKRLQQPYVTYTGGLVLAPKPGLHEDIAVLDFKSMYPNIMITYNLSPDTYIAPGTPEPEAGVNVAPEVNYKFRKTPPGFYKEALEHLISERSKIRKQMKQLDPKSAAFQVLDARQKATKIVTNAAYGYAGWIGARWYIKQVAEAASAWGRHIILSASKRAQEKGLTVIYGDTDSLFLKNNQTVILELQKEIGQRWGLEVEVGEVYTRLFFTEAKKRYAGLRRDGSLDIVGLEVIRGDWADVAKNVQEQVLEIILKGEPASKAVKHVHLVISNLHARKVAFRDLVIWKTLTKPVDGYAVKASHVEAAKMLASKGWRLTTGDKVGYVILKGKGRLYTRVKPYQFAEYEEIDTEYYVTNQVVPAAERILEFFGVTEQQLLSGEAKTEEKTSLMEFIKK